MWHVNKHQFYGLRRLQHWLPNDEDSVRIVHSRSPPSLPAITPLHMVSPAKHAFHLHAASTKTTFFRKQNPYEHTSKLDELHSTRRGGCSVRMNCYRPESNEQLLVKSTLRMEQQ
uniref:Ovule protein n=1 Tax=Ascaris lumbricoides TaxID=6252 RepID=A0A0M3HPX2_ASCLU